MALSEPQKLLLEYFNTEFRYSRLEDDSTTLDELEAYSTDQEFVDAILSNKGLSKKIAEITDKFASEKLKIYQEAIAKLHEKTPTKDISLETKKAQENLTAPKQQPHTDERAAQLPPLEGAYILPTKENIDSLIKRLNIPSHQINEEDYKDFNLLREGPPNRYHYLELLIALGDEKNINAYLAIFTNTELREAHPLLIDAINNVRSGLDNVKELILLMENPATTEKYLSRNNLITLIKIHLEKNKNFNLDKYLIGYTEETKDRISNIFAEAGYAPAPVEKKVDSLPPIPTESLPPIPVKLNPAIEKLKQAATSVINRLALEHNDDDIESLQLIQIQAMAKGASDVVDRIKKFLNDNPEINKKYLDMIIAKRTPVTPTEISAAPVHEMSVPYFHHQIDINHLHRENGKLLTDSKINNAKTDLKDKQLLEESAGYGYRILKLQDINGNDVPCAVYPPPLGKGNFGEVAIAQNLVTGEWIAVKFQNVKSEKEIASINKEIAAQTEAGEFVGQTRLTDGRDQIVLAIKLAEGIELKKAIDNRNQFLGNISKNIWLTTGSKILEAYHRTFWALGGDPNSGQVHRDIKPANMMINPVTGRITFIDRGFAATKINGEVKSSSSMGSPQYMAPELFISGKDGKYTYNEQTEIFAIGVSLLEFFQFPFEYDPRNSKFINGIKHGNLDDPNLIIAMSQFPGMSDGDPTLRDAMHEFLKRMTDQDPKKRPSLQECREFFKLFENLKLNVDNKIKQISIFDIDEYRRASKVDKLAIIEKLKEGDISEVWLIDSAPRKDANGYPKPPYEYYKIVSELQKAGVLVGDKLFTQPETKTLATRLQLIKGMREHVEKVHSADVTYWRYVTSEIPSAKFRQELNSAGIASTFVGSKAIIDIAEFKDLDQLQKQIMINELRKAGQVFLINSDLTNKDDTLYQAVKNELRNYGISVSEKVSDKQNNMSDLIVDVVYEEDVSTREIYFVTNRVIDDATKDDLKSIRVNCTEPIPQLVDHEQLKKITQALESEAIRLNKEYWDRSPEVMQIVNQIRDLAVEFNNLYQESHTGLSLPEVVIKLDHLQQQMYRVAGDMLLEAVQEESAVKESALAVQEVKEHIAKQVLPPPPSGLAR